MISIFKRLLEAWNGKMKALELQQRLIDEDIETGDLVRFSAGSGTIPGTCVLFVCENDEVQLAWDYLAHVPDNEKHEIELLRHRPSKGPTSDPSTYTNDGDPSFETIEQAVAYIKNDLANT